MKKQPNKKPTNSTPEVAVPERMQMQWPSLTGLRGLAALWVLLLHVYLIAAKPPDLWPALAWLMNMGGMGVDVFFTLSAFLLSLPFAERLRYAQPRPDLRRYFLKRVFRIFPAYYFQMAVMMVLIASGIGFGTHWKLMAMPDLLAHAVLWINAWPLVPAYVPSWWTLPVEFGFYLLLPMLAKCLTDKRWYWLLPVIGLSLLYRYWLLGLGLTRAEEIYWGDHLPGRLFEFLIGMLAAYFFVRLRGNKKLPGEITRNLIVIFSFVALLSLPALGWLQSSDTYLGSPTRDPVLAFWHVYAAIFIVLILVALASGRNFFDGFLQSMPLQWLGRISYGLYLWHYPVLVALRENMGGVDAARAEFTSFLVSGFLISLTIAFLSWHWLEAPILKRVGSSAAG